MSNGSRTVASVSADHKWVFFCICCSINTQFIHVKTCQLSEKNTEESKNVSFYFNLKTAKTGTYRVNITGPKTKQRIHECKSPQWRNLILIDCAHWGSSGANCQLTTFYSLRIWSRLEMGQFLFLLCEPGNKLEFWRRVNSLSSSVQCEQISPRTNGLMMFWLSLCFWLSPAGVGTDRPLWSRTGRFHNAMLILTLHPSVDVPNFPPDWGTQFNKLKKKQKWTTACLWSVQPNSGNKRQEVLECARTSVHSYHFRCRLCAHLLRRMRNLCIRVLSRFLVQFLTPQLCLLQFSRQFFHFLSEKKFFVENNLSSTCNKHHRGRSRNPGLDPDIQPRGRKPVLLPIVWTGEEIQHHFCSTVRGKDQSRSSQNTCCLGRVTRL